ncbi:MAG: dipeptidase [Woeseiaceae bacterium]
MTSMGRRQFVQGIGAGIAATSLPALASEYPKHYFKFHTERASHIDFGLTPDQEQHALELHKSIFVFDGETEAGYYAGLYDNVLAGSGAGVGGSFTIGAYGIENAHGLTEDIQIQRSDWWTRETLDRDVAFIQKQTQDFSGQILLCRNSTDLEKARQSGRIGMMLDVQNTVFIGNDIYVLDAYQNVGVRRVQLTYNRTVPAGTGCMEPRDGGLTVFGRDVVEHLNELQMIVDTGHSSPLTLMDAIDVSNKPITCSHAGLRSTIPTNPRSQPDDALKKLADNGGVFGLVAFPGALVGSDHCTVADYVDQLAKAVNIMGIDHVGFAMDTVSAASLDELLTAPEWPAEAAASVGVGIWPGSDGHKGLENQSGYPNITRGLLAAGFNDSEIAKIMGGNWLRLIEDVIG